MQAFLLWLIRYRRFVLVGWVASLVLASLFAMRIQSRFQFRDFYDYPGNPAIPVLESYHRDFGDPAGNVVVLLESDDAFQPDRLKYVDTLTKAIEPLPLFRRVRSLTTVRANRAVGDDVVAGLLIPSLPVSSNDAEVARRVALADPLMVRRIISADGRATAVLAEMKTPSEFSSIDEQREAIRAVQRQLALSAPPSGVQAIVTGAPVVEVQTTDDLMNDQQRLMPIVFAVLVGLLLLTFRSFLGAALPLAAVVTSLLWTMAIFALMKRPLDMIGSIIPTSLIVYGVVDPIFVLSRYLDKVHRGQAKEDAIVSSVSELAAPCLFTSLTTAVGFAAFIPTPIATVRYYGITVAIGVILAWVTTVTVLPLLLSLFPAPSPRAAGRALSSRAAPLFSALWPWLRARPFVVVASAAALLFSGLWAASTREVVNDYVRGVPPGPVRDTITLLENQLTGVIRTVVYLQGEPGSMRRPEVLKAIDTIDRFAESQPLVTTSTSVVDLIKDVNRAFHGGGPEGATVPKSTALIEQYLSLVDPDDLGDFVTSDESRAQIAILSRDRGSKPVRAMQAEIERVARTAIEGTGVQMSLTGQGVAGYREMDRIAVDMLYGFVVAFAAIVILVAIVFRSWRAALVSIIPNLVPTAGCFLVLVAMHSQIRVDNAIMFCIAVGALFNTTIQFIARARATAAVRPDAPVDERMASALSAVGPPSLVTAVVLSLGFGVLCFSNFPGLQILGVMCAVTMMLGFLSDAAITPLLTWHFLETRRPGRLSTPRVPDRGAAMPLDTHPEEL